MGLEDLPAEILFQIFENFCPHCQDQHRLHSAGALLFRDPACRSLSCVSRYVGRIAQRVLHHEFGYDRNETGPERAALFFRTICERPELGRELRCARLKRFPDNREEHRECWPLDAEYLGTGPGAQLLTSAILTRAPNLERLDALSGHTWTCFDPLNHEDATPVSALPQNLKHLSLKGYCTHPRLWEELRASPTRLANFISAFPRLESLDVYHRLPPLVSERSSLQHLRVLRLGGFSAPEDFDKLILCAPLLEELVMSRPMIGEDMTSAFPQICQVLAQRNGTLRRLAVRISCAHEDITPLSMLTGLQELKMRIGSYTTEIPPGAAPLNSQALVRILPPSLRKLQLCFENHDALGLASEALMTYISSTYRAAPGEQKLWAVYFEGCPEDNAIATFDRDKYAIQQRCQEWTGNGNLVFCKKLLGWNGWEDLRS